MTTEAQVKREREIVSSVSHTMLYGHLGILVLSVVTVWFIHGLSKPVLFFALSSLTHTAFFCIASLGLVFEYDPKAPKRAASTFLVAVAFVPFGLIGMLYLSA